MRHMRREMAVAESCWYLLKVNSMSTITREWRALHLASSLPFADILLSAQVPLPFHMTDALSASLWCSRLAINNVIVCAHDLQTTSGWVEQRHCKNQAWGFMIGIAECKGGGVQVPSSQRVRRMQVPEAMREAMEQSYNASQMQAVTSGLDGLPLVLIQVSPLDPSFTA